MNNASFEKDKGDRGDAAAIGLEGAVPPSILAFKAAACRDQYQLLSHSSFSVSSRTGGKNAPHTEHVNEMLLRDVVLPVDVPLQRREDALALEKGVSTVDLEL